MDINTIIAVPLAIIIGLFIIAFIIFLCIAPIITKWMFRYLLFKKIMEFIKK